MKSDLNEKQQKAVHLGSGPAMILAGPGSGKTTVILERIKYLIDERNILPKNILVITFTKAAALEMKNRAANILNQSNDSPFFGTIHSYFYSVLKHSYQYRNFSIITTKQKYRQLEHILKTYDSDMHISNRALQDFLSEISKLKNNVTISKDLQHMGFSYEQFRTFYEMYNQRNYEQKLMDYDDILLLSLKLLQNNEQILKVIQKEAQYILVDEFQDINKMQYELISLLAGKEGNLFVVGDDDQSIYRFRGAGEENLRRFERDFIAAQKIILDINYRCPSEIVKVSSKLIEHNPNRFRKDLKSGKAEKGDIICKKFKTKDEERQFIVKEIKSQKGYQKSIAILCRTNSQLAYFVELLKKENLNFYIKEKPVRLYESEFISPIIGYLMFATGIDKSRKRVFSFLNQPTRYIDRELFVNWSEKYRKLCSATDSDCHMKKALLKLDRILESLGTMKPEIAVTYILKVVGYEKFVLDHCRTTDNVKRFKEEIEELRERAKMYDSLKEWMEYVKWEEDTEYVETPNCGGKEREIFLYTFHASKGLEFDTVFIPHLNEGSVPYGKDITNEEMEEERRMLYVALTRSSEKLYVTFVESDTKKDTVSRFIKECAFTVST